MGQSRQTQPAPQVAAPTVQPASASYNQTQYSTATPDHVSQTAAQFATSYNQAVMDKEALSIAAMNNDHLRSQELIRSYSNNLEVSKNSYQALRRIAEDQGTGDITIFCPHNSAQIQENSLQYTRLIRYLDSLERNNRERELVFVIIGSSSATGEANHNQTLSRQRANAPVPIIDQYMVNVPHSYHKVYGTGEAYSPKDAAEDVNKRYRFVRIMALFGGSRSRAVSVPPMMDLGPSIPMNNQKMNSAMYTRGTAMSSHYSAPRQPNEYVNSFGMKFIRVPAGTFMMGSPDTEIGRDSNEILHEVTLTRDYYLQATEVTQQQWLDVMGTQPSYFKNCGMDCPVENIRHTDAMAFINKLNKTEHTTHYRLPTEAEWEYAARAGSTSAFFNGPMIQVEDNNQSPYLDSVGWYYHNARHAPHRVALKAPNAWGFYDMHGNVWEWCSDWQRPYPFHAEVDPIGAEFSKSRIRRGGSWAHYPSYCRSAYRSWYDPEDRSPELGFRVAITRIDRNQPTPLPPVKPMVMPAVKPAPQPKRPAEPVPMPGPPQVTQCIMIRDISFDLASARIKPRMVPLLDRAAEILQQQSGKIELHGHTCALGSKPSNMQLGQRRAESVKAYLISKGITADRITTRSYGEEAPKFTNMTDAGRSLNRRVEILLYGSDDIQLQGSGDVQFQENESTRFQESGDVQMHRNDDAQFQDNSDVQLQ